MTEAEEIRRQLEKMRADAIAMLEQTAGLARAIIDVCDEALSPVPPPPGAHRKRHRHLHVVPGIAAAALLAWRLLRRPAAVIPAAGLAAASTLIATMPYTTLAPQGPARTAPPPRHVHVRRRPLPVSVPSPVPSAGSTAPAPPSAPHSRRASSAAPSGSTAAPAPSPATATATTGPSPSPAVSVSAPVTATPPPSQLPACIGLLHLKLCL